MAPEAFHGENVREGLRRVLVTAVAGIDERHLDVMAGHAGRTLLGMAHGRNVGVAFDGTQRVGDALTLCGGAGVGL